MHVPQSDAPSFGTRIFQRIVTMAPPFSEVIAVLTLLYLSFDRFRWDDFRIIPFDLPELLGRDEADGAARLFGQENPGDLLHITLTRSSPVIVRIALAHRKSHRAIVREIPAENLFFRHAKPFHDMAPATGDAQGFGVLWGAVLDFDRDHTFLFSKKRFRASD